MSHSPSDRIARIIDPPVRASAAPARTPLEPLVSLPVLIGWMLGPPAPMPRRRAVLDATVLAVPPAEPVVEPDTSAG